jgi:ent-kaurene oxidase
MLLCYIVLQYDFRFVEEQGALPFVWHGEMGNPDPRQMMEFKKLPGPKKFAFL